MIGILTLYHDNTNYGGLLQSYALQKVITERYGECEQISYECTQSSLAEKMKNNLFDLSFRDIWLVLLRKAAACFTKKNTGTIAGYLENRRYLIREFEEEIRHSAIVGKESIQKFSDRYSYLIAGSDQVWCGGVDLPNFLFAFASKDTVKISYAASAPGEKLNRLQKQEFALRLNQFKAVSVREENFKKVLEPYTFKEIDEFVPLSGDKYF